MKIEYLRKTVYGSVMSIGELQTLGNEGWELCAAVKMTDISFNYIFKRYVTQVYVENPVKLVELENIN